MPVNRPTPQPVRDQAVAMVTQLRAETGRFRGAVPVVARRFGVTRQAIHNWLGQAEARAAASTTMSTTLADRVAALERENRELRAANSVLTAAAAIFARELTPFPVAKRPR